MRLFIAREALDPHLKAGGAVLNSELPVSVRLRAAAGAALFYAGWYPRQWLPAPAIRVQTAGADGALLARHLRHASGTSRRLARALFHAMLRHGPGLERQQLLLGRFVEIGTELFAIAATCLRADQLIASGSPGYDRSELIQLADYFCSTSRLRIEDKFRAARRNTDRAGYRLAQRILEDNGSVTANGASKHG